MINRDESMFNFLKCNYVHKNKHLTIQKKNKLKWQPFPCVSSALPVRSGDTVGADKVQKWVFPSAVHVHGSAFPVFASGLPSNIVSGMRREMHHRGLGRLVGSIPAASPASRGANLKPAVLSPPPQKKQAPYCPIRSDSLEQPWKH